MFPEISSETSTSSHSFLKKSAKTEEASVLAREIRLLKCTARGEEEKIVTRIENYDLCSALFNLFVA
jgi:hypothetical protein